MTWDEIVDYSRALIDDRKEQWTHIEDNGKRKALLAVRKIVRNPKGKLSAICENEWDGIRVVPYEIIERCEVIGEVETADTQIILKNNQGELVF